MVNKQQYINEEELYQQIMAELEPGAAEFDRMMANGENPASKAKLCTNTSACRTVSQIRQPAPWQTCPASCTA